MPTTPVPTLTATAADRALEPRRGSRCASHRPGCPACSPRPAGGSGCTPTICTPSARIAAASTSAGCHRPSAQTTGRRPASTRGSAWWSIPTATCCRSTSSSPTTARTSSAPGSGTQHGEWPLFAKFFDNEQALPFHVHHRDEHAPPLGKVVQAGGLLLRPADEQPPGRAAGLVPRPAATRHPRPNCRSGSCGFGEGGDNRITELSLGYRTRLGTGWDIPAGVLHAPASACTYEPQAASDVLCMCESWSNNREVPDELLWKDTPADRVGDLDYILDLLDWELNVDPDFVTNRQLIPVRDRRVRRRRRSRLRREVDRLQVAHVQREGAHRPAGRRPSRSPTPTPTGRSWSRGTGPSASIRLRAPP